jgi:hypothetical protein
MIRHFILFGLLIISALLECCTHKALLINVSEPHSKNLNGFLNTFDENGRISNQSYYIDGQCIFSIYYGKHGRISSLCTHVSYPEYNNILNVACNQYYHGKLISCQQMNLDSLNRFYDLETINNGQITFDSLSKINDSINNRDRFLHWDTTFIPFRIMLVENKDTTLTDFKFYLTKYLKIYLPILNEKLNCYSFKNVDSICDFNLEYKNRKIIFNNIETVRLMFESEWIITIDPEASDTCFDIMSARAGCFMNVYQKEISECKHNNFIFIRDFRISYK